MDIRFPFAATRRLKRNGLFTVNDLSKISIGFHRDRPLLFEPPVELRSGIFDLEQIGAFSYLGGGHASFRHIDRVGRFCAFASNVMTGEVEHPTSFLSPHPVFEGWWNAGYPEIEAYLGKNADVVGISRDAVLDFDKALSAIEIGNNVWIGEGAFIRRGVKIGDGAIIAARTVVIRDVPAYSIIAGVPAKTVRQRFSDRVCERLTATRWWTYGLTALDGVDITTPEDGVSRIEDNIANGSARIFAPEFKRISNDGRITLASAAYRPSLSAKIYRRARHVIVGA